jgi:predicted Co/Zn/Cd cation transporter (cation efflux family)
MNKGETAITPENLMPSSIRTANFRRERWALRFSALAGLSLAIVAAFIGPMSHSSAVLFDGLYGLLGVALSTFAAWVSSVIEAGPTHKHPFGRDALTPLVIVGEAMIMLTTSLVAVAASVIAVVQHRGGVPSAGALVYAGIATLISALAWVLLRGVPSSDVVEAELWQWRAGAVLSVLLFIGLAAAGAAPTSAWAPDVDAVLVGVVSLCLIYPAARLMRRTIRELTESRPESELDERVTRCVADVAGRHGLRVYELRTAKTGKLYVEIEFVVPESYTVARGDALRRELERKLRFVPGELWLTVEFTATPSFATT